MAGLGVGVEDYDVAFIHSFLPLCQLAATYTVLFRLLLSLCGLRLPPLLLVTLVSLTNMSCAYLRASHLHGLFSLRRVFGHECFVQVQQARRVASSTNRNSTGDQPSRLILNRLPVSHSACFLLFKSTLLPMAWIMRRVVNRLGQVLVAERQTRKDLRYLPKKKQKCSLWCGTANGKQTSFSQNRPCASPPNPYPPCRSASLL